MHKGGIVEERGIQGGVSRIVREGKREEGYFPAELIKHFLNPPALVLKRKT